TTYSATFSTVSPSRPENSGICPYSAKNRLLVVSSIKGNGLTLYIASHKSAPFKNCLIVCFICSAPASSIPAIPVSETFSPPSSPPSSIFLSLLAFFHTPENSTVTDRPYLSFNFCKPSNLHW